MSNRQGKIARLPFAVREELNQRLLDNQHGVAILAWLNALPEMALAGGAEDLGPVSLVNLSLWRTGGHADWLRRKDRVQEAQSLRQWCVQVGTAGGGKLAEGISTVMAEQILEVMEGLGRLQSEIREMEDETERNAKWVEIAKTVVDVARALATVRGGDHQREKLALEERALGQKDQLIELNRARFQRVVCKRLLDEGQRSQIAKIAMSDAEYEAKLEEIRRVAFADVEEMVRSGELERLTPE